MFRKECPLLKNNMKTRTFLENLSVKTSEDENFCAIKRF